MLVTILNLRHKNMKFVTKYQKISIKNLIDM